MTAAFLRPWRGSAYRHIPSGSPFPVLDTRFAGRSGANRWNEAGEPTLYLAGDRGVALAEFARHFRERLDAASGRLAASRDMFRLDCTLSAVFDLRDAPSRASLGLVGGVNAFLDVSIARATATFIRRTTSAEAILVPSVAYLDDLTRWNLVLLLDKLPTDLSTFITVVPSGTLRVEP